MPSLDWLSFDWLSLDRRPQGWFGAATMPLRIARRLARGGLQDASRRVGTKLSIAWQEWRWGLKTESFIPWQELSSDACSVDYEPTTYTALQRVLKHVRPDADDVFVDYGCGLGRVLAVAHRHGFRRLIGLELSPELCRQAKQNLDRSLGADAKQVEIRCGNAAEADIPDEATVFYLFNPFRGIVLQQMLDRLHESLQRRPRCITLLYLQPLGDENTLRRREWLQLRHEETLEGIRFCVFEHRM